MTNVFISLGLIALLGSFLQIIFPDWDIENFRKSINKLVLYILLPALIFKVIYLSELGKVFYEIPIAAAAGVLGCLLIAWVIFHFIRIEPKLKGSLILASAFGNVTYLGLPVLQGIFSSISLVISKVAILCEVTVAPLNLIIGSMIAMHYSDVQKHSFKQILKQVLQLPPIWAVVIALCFKIFHFPVPDFILDGTEVLGNTVSGLMILSLGMALKFQKFGNFNPLLVVVIIKLFLSPIIVFSMAKLLQIDNPYFEAMTIEGAMPSQLLTFVIADRFSLDSELLAKVIFINTMIAFFTIPLVRAFLF